MIMDKKPPSPFFILRGHEGVVTTLHFICEEDAVITANPSLISGSDIGEIFIWNLKNYRIYHKLEGHKSKMIAYLNYYKSSLISQGRDGHINIWSYINHEWVIKCQLSCSGIGFCAAEFFPSEDDSYLIALNEDKTFNIYNFETGDISTELKAENSSVMCMCIKVFRIGINLFLLAGYEDGFIGLWDCESKLEKAHINCHAEPVMCLDFDSLHKNRGISGSADKTLQTWKLRDDLQLIKEQQITITNAGINAIRIREDGKVVFTAGWDCSIRVFSWKTLKPLAVIKFHTLSVQCLACCDKAVNKNTSVLASGSKDKNIALWSLY